MPRVHVAAALLAIVCTPAYALGAKPLCTRRAALCGCALSLVTRPTFAAPAPAQVASYPPLEYLEPFYELKFSLDALAAVVTDSERWPTLRKRLQKFCGGPLSEQYYYAGLAQAYTNQIKYNDLETFVGADKRERQAAVEQIIESMRALKEGLEAQAPEAEGLLASARAAQKGMSRWLSLVPADDIGRVEELVGAVRRADLNRDGRLSADELASLPSRQREVWQARVALVGD